MAEDLRRVRYREAVNRIKNLKQGTPEWQKNADIITSIGSALGFKWQDDLPAGYTPSTQPPAAQPPAPNTPTSGSGGVFTPNDKNTREQDEVKYKEAVNRLKNLQPGTPEHNKNLEIISDLGNKHGWKWQDNAPEGYTPPSNTPAPTTPEPVAPTPATPTTPTPQTPFEYAFQPGDEVIVRKGLSGVQLSPEEGRRFQQIAFHDLIPNASTPAERKSLSLVASQSIHAYGKADGVPEPNQWNTAKINNPDIIPPNFDAQAYIAANPDIAASGADPLQHFLDHGIYEDRVFTKDGKKTSEFFDGVGNWRPPAAPETPAETPAETPPPATEPPKSPLDEALLQKAVANLFPTDPAFHEGSALYRFQRDEGMGSLEKLMSSRGLTGSGAEIEANSKFLNQLGAEESAREREYQLKKSGLASAASQYVLGLNADDQYRAAQLMLDSNTSDKDFISKLLSIGAGVYQTDQTAASSDADRALTAADMQTRNDLTASANGMRAFLDFINSGFTQSPLGGALDAAAGIGDNASKGAESAAKITSTLFKRPTGYASTGGGGGGGGYYSTPYAPYVPPSSRPGSPNMSTPNLIGAFTGAANNNGYLNAANNFFSGMFSGGKSGGSMF